ncbi:NAD-dependent epimerase/dehydratase family protein [Amycolatopsis tolypomycina]|uniref:Nucleoside-diphosphate-sugar epimerase n=1 Tax=Amycolatopsis tolypomycina TaxID=208445 RepID=A0A1H4YUS2_9PSEU|nr:SDR family oxidoreductase [Amycolatopsis tolypomycina]SED21752.1 Nucleoside-diphosphate-sugar epimerase [Amycolatopsis tolypomycina]
MTTVSVSGGGGYVGSVLVPLLLAGGHRVRVLDLFLFGEQTLPAHPMLEIHRGDIRDDTAVSRWLSGSDVAIHLAGIANDPSCALDRALSWDINVGGSSTIIDAARRSGVRLFVYTSSASVYGRAEDRPVDEESPTAPITVYGETKLRTEELLRAAAGPDFRPVIIRPAALYGYSPRLRLDLTVNLFANHAVHRGAVTVFGGAQLRPTLHVADLCRLILALLRNSWQAQHCAVFNAGNENSTVQQIASRVVDAVNSRLGTAHSRATVSTVASDDQRSYAIDSTAVRRILGFRPARAMEAGVDGLCDAFSRDLVPDPLDDDRYYNVRRVQRLLGSLS